MRARFFAALVFGASVLLLAYLLVKSGLYGVSLFGFVPILVGALGAWAFDARTEKTAMLAGSVTGFLGTILFLLMGLEGLICIVMVLPLVVPLGAVGGWIAYELKVTVRRPTRAGFLLLVLPASVAWDL